MGISSDVTQRIPSSWPRLPTPRCRTTSPPAGGWGDRVTCGLPQLCPRLGTCSRTFTSKMTRNKGPYCFIERQRGNLLLTWRDTDSEMSGLGPSQPLQQFAGHGPFGGSLRNLQGWALLCQQCEGLPYNLSHFRAPPFTLSVTSGLSPRAVGELSPPGGPRYKFGPAANLAP